MSLYKYYKLKSVEDEKLSSLRCKLIHEDPIMDQITLKLSNGETRTIAKTDIEEVDGPIDKAEKGLVDRSQDVILKLASYYLKEEDVKYQSLGSDIKVQPFPHQFLMVKKIIDGDYKSHMIADDVGLGKTIETGFLIKQLRRLDLIKSILLIVPAGLKEQWDEEMEDNFSEFFGYCDSWTKNDWNIRDMGIVSRDLIKLKHRIKNLEDTSRMWDLIVFDECHDLSRTQKHTTLRWHMAKIAVNKSKYTIFLTGTPHKGRNENFIELLKLIDYEKFKDISDVSQVSLSDMNSVMTRFKRSDAVDWENQPLFKGNSVDSTPVIMTKDEEKIDKKLQEYLRKGYGAAESLADPKKGRAIGWVMNVFRKLHASSQDALLGALKKRKKHLEEGILDFVKKYGEEDIRFKEEYEGHLLTDKYKKSLEKYGPFFDGEIEKIKELIKNIKSVSSSPSKLIALKEWINKIVQPDKKVLIFTQYLKTQDMLKNFIKNEYGIEPLIINGSTGNKKKDIIKNFGDEKKDRFLISTEAGSEGFNMHKSCHLMVNYDLPWNPMKLYQRIGRLDRIGQKRKVLVRNFNSQTSDKFSSYQSMDSKIINILESKIEETIDALKGKLDWSDDSDLKEIILGRLEQEESKIDEIFTKAAFESPNEISQRIDNIFQRIVGTSLKDLACIERLHPGDVNGAISNRRYMSKGYDFNSIKHYLKRYLEAHGRRLLKSKDEKMHHFMLPDLLIENYPHLWKKYDNVVFEREFQDPNSNLIGFSYMGNPGPFDCMVESFMINDVDATLGVAQVDDALEAGYLYSFRVDRQVKYGGIKFIFDGVISIFFNERGDFDEKISKRIDPLKLKVSEETLTDRQREKVIDFEGTAWRFAKDEIRKKNLDKSLQIVNFELISVMVLLCTKGKLSREDK